MQDLTTLKPEVAEQFRAIADQRDQEQRILQSTPEDIVDFYLKSYDFVQIVKCLECNADLCLWVLDPAKVRQNMAQLHHFGLKRVELGNSLLSTRKRHDGVIGYKCICGNNSILGEIEKNIVPQASGIIPNDEPYTAALVKKKMLSTNFQPTVEIINDEEVIEGFSHKILKGKVG